MDITMTESSDKFLEWVLGQEAILLDEYEQQGFISAFVTTFIDAGMSRAKLNIKEIDKLRNYNNKQMIVYKNSTVVIHQDQEIIKRFRVIAVRHNKALDDLDNGLLVLERMKEFVTSKKETAPNA